MTQNTETKKDNIDKTWLHKSLKAFIHQKYHTEWGKEDLQWRSNSYENLYTKKCNNDHHVA